MNQIRRDADLLLAEWLNDEDRLSCGLGVSDEESALPDFDEDAPEAWPYYAAMLDLTSSPAVAEWLGWQRIMYYLWDGMREWPQRGMEIVHEVAVSASESPRVGQFLSQRLLLDLAETSPGVAALAVEVLDHHYQWRMAENLLSIRDSLLSSPDPVLRHKPHCDFASRGLRASIVRPFDTLSNLPGLDFPDMTSSLRWSAAVANSIDAKPTAPSAQDLVRSLAPAHDGKLDPLTRDQIVADALEAGIQRFYLDEAFLAVLADAVESSDLGPGLVTGLALAELLRQISTTQRRSANPGWSTWRVFHPRKQGD
ncbi:hypothetical protein [Microbacterium sp. 22296]|uniref:hypothetical protein n=1 Tax=Microbacterium sp. 22296 TaxID=3453903 RepID=UPI003F825AB2